MAHVRFPNRRGQNLSGVFHEPSQGPYKTTALFAHCFTCTKNIRAAVTIADTLAQAGIGVLRFDFTGLGQSEGDFADTHFSSNVADLIDAASFLSATYSAPALLVGHSLGGTAVLAAAHSIPSAKAVVTLGSPSDAEHVLHLIEEDIARIEEQGEATVKLAGQPFRIRKDFIDDTRAQSVRSGLGRLGKALLVMHSPNDDTVSIDQASEIFLAARHPKSFVTLDHADHLLSKQSDAQYAASVMSAWAGRYIMEDNQPLHFPKPRPDAVVTENTTDDGLVCTINADGHPLIADEPVPYGGTNRGTTPYGLLSSALGACTAMTLNLYAKRKQLPVHRILVTTRHDKIHAQDCEDCETLNGKVDQFSRQISIEGDLTEEQRARMLEIADRCPVHRTLHSEIKIQSQ